MHCLLKPLGFTLASAIIAVTAGFLALTAPRAALAEHPDCEVHALGDLSAEAGVPLTASGRWTAEDCDSRFRAGSDAATYSFAVAERGRVRIDLASAEADSYLYLLAADGGRIADNDDGAAGLDARIERVLEPGSYLVEATTVGGRGRGPAGFSLSIVRLSCDPVDLGVLAPGADLTASGVWTLDTCGSRIVAEHPAHNYTVTLAAPGRVRIDLVSEHGDPVLSLASPVRGVIGANDDGGAGYNSRIEQYLFPGVYTIEATTYRRRDLQALGADFTLTIDLADEAAAQQRFLLKMEEARIPEQVIAGEPFAVEYRIGNLGGGDLPAGASVVAYAYAPRSYDEVRGIPASLWSAGAAHHSGSEAARLSPLTITPVGPGPSWVSVGVIVLDADDEEIASHRIWRDFTVLSGPTFGPVTVTVDGAAYEVTAAAGDEGEVTTSVASPDDPAGEIDAGLRARAIYAAAVRSLVLDGVFDRTVFASLPATAEPAPVALAHASSSTLLRAFAGRYAAAVDALGVTAPLGDGEAISPLAVEDLTLHLAGTASAQYAYLAASWSALQERVADGGALSFAEARALQTGLAYAERVLAPLIAAGEIVGVARAAEGGWDDPAVRARLRLWTPSHERSCDVTAARASLEAAGVEALGELAAALPAHALALDAVLCGVAGIDAANASFLRRLGVSDPGLARLDAPDPAPLPPRSIRIIARLAADGRVEHGVELAGGAQLLPAKRFLETDAAVGRWHISSDVGVAGSTLGRIRARWLADGRIEWSFRDAAGEVIVPGVRFLPSDPPPGAWFHSAPIEVAPVRQAPE